MSDIYSAPTADLSTIGDIEQQAFYVVSPIKFTLMFFATFGLYSYYWFYKNWANQKIVTNENTSPFWRTVFQIFFVHSLFSRIEFHGTDKNITPTWHAPIWATAYVVILIASSILDRLAYKEIGSPYTDLAGYGLILVDFIILFKVQKIINLVCSDVEGDSNKTITPANIAWMLLGVVLWALAILGVYALFVDDFFF